MSTEEVKLQVEMISGGWSAPGTSFWSTHVVPLPKRRGISSAELRYFFCMDVLDRLDFFYKLIMGEKTTCHNKNLWFLEVFADVEDPHHRGLVRKLVLGGRHFAGGDEYSHLWSGRGQSRFGGPDSNMARNHAFERLGKWSFEWGSTFFLLNEWRVESAASNFANPFFWSRKHRFLATWKRKSW